MIILSLHCHSSISKLNNVDITSLPAESDIDFPDLAEKLMDSHQ